MRDVLPAFAKDVIDVDELGVRGVGHAVIAHEDDINDIGEIARLELVMELPREDVDLLQDFLLKNLCEKFDLRWIMTSQDEH